MKVPAFLFGGGDVSETVVLLDQATVVHPYRYESPTGGVFGTIPSFMVQGTVFFHRWILRPLWQCAFRGAVHGEPKHARATEL